MAIGKKIVEIADAFNNLVMAGATSKITQKVVGTASKVTGKVVDTGAGILNKGLKGGQSVYNTVKNPTSRKAMTTKLNDGVGKVIKNTITDEDAYRSVKTPFNIKDTNNLKSNKSKPDIQVANKFLIGDELNRRVKTTLDLTASTLGGKHPLVKTGADNLLPGGIHATKLGIGVMATGAMIAGVPKAGKQWIDNRRGTNQDSTPYTSAPKIPAYANNGGATGDLVFALNNLRNGGFM